MIMLIVCILSYSLGGKFAHGKFRVRKSCPKVTLAAAERACLQLISSLEALKVDYNSIHKQLKA